MKEHRVALAQNLIDAVNEIVSISGYRATIKKYYSNLAEILKWITPNFDEIKDSEESMSEGTIRALVSLLEALSSAKELLKSGTKGSKIYLVLQREQIRNKFHEVTSQLEQALSGICHENLDISDDFKEQSEYFIVLLRRAKGRFDSPDVELYEELLALYNQSSDTTLDPAVLRRLAKELELMKISDLEQESLALHEMVCASGGDPGENFEMISMLLKKFEDFVQIENLERKSSPNSSGQSSADNNQKIPDAFLCPISLEMMKDPVVILTGQTYERSCIEKWLEAGNRTCPKTRQTLSKTTLIPNKFLRSCIAEWCEDNGIKPPEPPRSSGPTKTILVFPAECAAIELFLRKLASGNLEEQRSAAGEICLLAKRNADNRVAIAEAGAIPILVRHLSSPDSCIQEHVVTALLNLSISDEYIGLFRSAGAIKGILHVLRTGCMEARENAAATLLNLLSVGDVFKVRIGKFDAIPPLVLLLNEGTQRGKKNAATALYYLCIYQGNNDKAVSAGIVPILMQLLTEPEGGTVDEALAVFAVLACHIEGRAAISAAKAVPILIEFIHFGSYMNKGNAVGTLLQLCAGDQHPLLEAMEFGIMDPVVDLAQNGTDIGKRNAAILLERLNRLGRG